MKDQILHKATEMFLNIGFKSVTMDELAQDLGISKKTIYSHYKNKTALVKASVNALFDTICHGIECICNEEKDSIQELYDIKRFVMMNLKDEKSSPQYQLQKYYPSIAQELKSKQFDHMHECVVKNITRGVSTGVYRETIDPEFISRIYFTGMIGIKDGTLFPASVFPIKKTIEQYLEYHLRGIVTPKGRKVLNEIIQSNQE